MDKVSFSWNLIMECNYRCPYCWFYGDWHRQKTKNKYLSLRELMKYWENIHRNYGSAHIDILGGEPFLYPDFTELIKELSLLHTVNITTNLSCNIDAFVKGIDPARASICPTFHPAFADFDAFLKKALLLKDHKFGNRVAYLAYPPQIKQINYYKDNFAKEDLFLSLMTFWGKYNGKEYPAGYTAEEKETIGFSLGDRGGEKFQVTPRKVKGMLCHAGEKYAAIYSDGTVFRCGGSKDSEAKSIIGNFFDENFRLLDKPLPCDYDSCPCNEWAFLGAKEAPALAEVKERSVPLPHDHSSTPPYKIQWNWEIIHNCNYKCSYCHFWNKGSKVDVWEVGRWKEKWEEIFSHYGCCHIRFSGGEPTIYPDFFKLVSALISRHTVDITTNLSFDIDDLLGRINPPALAISPSFHPEFDKIGNYLQKISILRKNNFFVGGISYVAYPEHLLKMGEIMRAVEADGIEFKIIPFNGEFKGRHYPQGYTLEEKTLLREAVDSSLSRDLNTRWLNWHVKEDDAGEDKNNTVAATSRLCRMGQMYAKIFPDGKVTRCCSPQSDILGNIFSDDFKILDEEKPCYVDKCPCFKGMFVGKEDDWLSYWGSPRHPEYKI
ncbi:MAG: radical SAM protein [Candidatus Omnitrophica bacterium]|nr:radical SAM protein [Candidatus Omnitrophota bacterium]